MEYIDYIFRQYSMFWIQKPELWLQQVY